MATQGGGVYYPLHATFCDTQASRRVKRAYGPSGFEAYVRLVCALLSEPDGMLVVEDNEDWADLAEQVFMPGMDIKGLVALLCKYGDFRLDGGRLSNPAVLESIRMRKELAERGRKAGMASGKARKAAGEFGGDSQ